MEDIKTYKEKKKETLKELESISLMKDYCGNVMEDSSLVRKALIKIIRNPQIIPDQYIINNVVYFTEGIKLSDYINNLLLTGENMKIIKNLYVEDFLDNFRESHFDSELREVIANDIEKRIFYSFDLILKDSNFEDLKMLQELKK